jgi:hypothetical protein
MASIQDSIAVGTRVMFSAQFLRSTGQHTGRSPFIAGTVLALVDLPGTTRTMARIAWEDGQVSNALTVNLWPADKRHLEPR